MSWIDELNQGTYGVSKTTPGNGISIDQWNAYQASQAPVETPKEKNFWLDQISTVGGIAGGALGSLASPIIGTGIGAGAGSALGEALENLLTGEDVGKNVLQEGALGAVFGAGPIKLAKGALAGGSALLKGAGGAVAKEAAKKAATTSILKGVGGKLASTGAETIADMLGIKTGAKIAGKGILSPSYIDDLTNLVTKNIKPKVGASAATILKQTQSYADDIGNQIAQKIAKTTKAVKPIDLASKITTGLDDLLQTDESLVTSVLNKVSGIKNVNDVWKLRQSVDDVINWGASTDTASTLKNATAKKIRDVLSGTIDDSVKGISELNKNYSMARDAIKLAQPSALKPKGINILGKNIGGQQAQGIQTGLGQAGQTLGGALGNIQSSAPGLLGQAARQVVPRQLLRQGQGTQPTTLEDAMMQTQGQTYQPSQTAQTTQQQTQSPFGYSADQIGQALMLAYSAGDKASSTQLQQMYELAKSYETSAPKYSSTVATALTDVQSSLSELNKLSSAIQSGNGEVSPIVGTLRSLNPYDVDQKTLLAMIDKTRQIVGKALEGGVLRKEDEEKYRKILPTTSDTKEVALNKIAMIREQLQERMSNYSGLVGAGSQTDDLTSALLQAQGSY